ncbi:hypothetical protein GCM10027347_61320 [Larkinella harenae]
MGLLFIGRIIRPVRWAFAYYNQSAEHHELKRLAVICAFEATLKIAVVAWVVSVAMDAGEAYEREREKGFATAPLTINGLTPYMPLSEIKGTIKGKSTLIQDGRLVFSKQTFEGHPGTIAIRAEGESVSEIEFNRHPFNNRSIEQLRDALTNRYGVAIDSTHQGYTWTNDTLKLVMSYDRGRIEAGFIKVTLSKGGF